MSNKVVIKFLADVDGINRGVQQVNSQLNGMEATASKAAKVFAALWAGNEILEFGKKLVNLASDYEQAAGAADTLYGAAGADKLKAWADTTAQAFGLSGGAALEAANQFAISGRAIGLEGDALVSYSTNLTSLAADLAATFGGTVPEAITAMSAALRGEFDPLERFGIAMNAATLEAYAMSQGVNESWAKMDLPTKQRLIAEFMQTQADSLGITGQAAREADTFAGQWQRLTATLEDLGRIVGTAVLPAVNSFIGGLSGIVSAITDWSKSSGVLNGILSTLSGWVLKLSLIFGTVIGSIWLLVTAKRAYMWVLLKVNIALERYITLMTAAAFRTGNFGLAINTATLSAGRLAGWLGIIVTAAAATVVAIQDIHDETVKLIDGEKQWWQTLGEGNTVMGLFAIGAANLSSTLQKLIPWYYDAVDAQERGSESAKMWGERYAGMVKYAPMTATAAKNVEALAQAEEIAGREAAAAAEELKRLTDALDNWNKKSSITQSTIDWERYWDKFIKGVDKGSKSLDLNTEKGRKNAEELLAGASLIADGYQQRLDRGWTPEAAREWALKRFNKIREASIDAGFKASDVDKILNVAGFDKATASLISKAATAGGQIGRGLGDGMIAGMASRERAVAAEAARLTAMAEAAARQESETHSPSKKWYLLGLDLVEGLTKGIEMGTLMADKIVTDSTRRVFISATSVVAEIPEKMAEAYKNKLGALQTVLDEQGAIIQSGLDAIKSMSDGFVNDILGNISFQTKDAQGNDLSPEQMVAAMGFDIEAQRKAVEAIATNIGATLPPALLSQILNMPSGTAIELAKYLGQNPDMITQLTNDYNNLATYTETALGMPMGVAWAEVGGKSATEMIESAKKKIEEEAEGFQKWVRKKLNTKIYIDVEYRYTNSPNDVMKQINSYENANGTSWRVS